MENININEAAETVATTSGSFFSSVKNLAKAAVAPVVNTAKNHPVAATAIATTVVVGTGVYMARGKIAKACAQVKAAVAEKKAEKKQEAAKAAAQEASQSAKEAADAVKKAGEADAAANDAKKDAKDKEENPKAA